MRRPLQSIRKQRWKRPGPDDPLWRRVLFVLGFTFFASILTAIWFSIGWAFSIALSSYFDDAVTQGSFPDRLMAAVEGGFPLRAGEAVFVVMLLLCPIGFWKYMKTGYSD